jgi:hypothetical protein
LAPTYIILDIDETIHINAYTHPTFGGCLMMCERGLEMYQRIISSHANYRAVSYAAKSALTKTLQAALQSKRTVEQGTADLLNSLQAANNAGNNIRIFGLTARYSHMAATTRKELLKLGIDLEKSSPFPMGVRKRMATASSAKGAGAAGNKDASPQQSPSPADRSLTPSPVLSSASVGSSPALGPMSLPAGAAAAAQQPYGPDVSWVDHPSFGTDARYQSGVIYTNASDKGPVLSRFLEFLWQSIEEDNHDVLAQNAATLAAYERAMQTYHASVAQAVAQQQQVMHKQQPPSHSPSLDDLAGQFACSSTGAVGGGGGGGVAGAGATSASSDSGNPSPSSSHSLLHTVSNPIPIHGQVATATSVGATGAHPTPLATPSPPDANMSLLQAASQVAQQRVKGIGGAPQMSGVRRGSRTTDHLLPPSSMGSQGDGVGLAQSPPKLSSAFATSPAASSAPAAAVPSVLRLHALSLLPTRLIFIDDRLQNCFSVYESLSAATLFDAYYNHQHKRRTLQHVPSALEVYTCHYVPKELEHTQPTNQTKADAAASAAAQHAQQAAADAQPDLELIEAQIHHFLTHGEILNDAKGRAILHRLREQEDAIKRRVADAEAAAKALEAVAAAEKAHAQQQQQHQQQRSTSGSSVASSNSTGSAGSSASAGSSGSGSGSIGSDALSGGATSMDDVSAASGGESSSASGAASATGDDPPSPAAAVVVAAAVAGASVSIVAVAAGADQAAMEPDADVPMQPAASTPRTNHAVRPN